MKNKLSKKKVIIICVAITLILIAGISIFLGIYFTKLTKPSYIFGVGIDKINDKITNYVSIDEKYNLGDSFSVESSLDFDLDSEEYQKKIKTDKEAKEKYQIIKNLSATTNNISLIQDAKGKKVLFELHSELPKEKLIDYKYLIKDSTSYYYVEDILNKYVNAGTNNYFEIFSDETTNMENIKYVHNAFVKGLKSSLDDKDFNRYNATENINGSVVNVNQISIKIDDKKLHKILNSTIDYLKNDEKANKILTNVYKDFSKYKIKDSKELLEKQESYTLNIYTSKYRNIALKYEIVHLKGDEKKIYSYEGNASKGTLYYIDDDTVIYTIDLSDDGKIIEGKIKSSSNKDIGIIKVEKNDTSKYFTFNFDDGNKKYDVIYSSKNSNLKENKSYDNEKNLAFKYLNDKVSILSGEITLNSKISINAKIEEDIADAVLYSTLSDNGKEKYNKRLESLKERLKK